MNHPPERHTHSYINRVVILIPIHDNLLGLRVDKASYLMVEWLGKIT